ncbi:MAG TPA: hypothetical protein VEY07_04630 [Thermoplasmata archaeon]|nr:hypothetical protein [Thermoplasmata archaeon]
MPDTPEQAELRRHLGELRKAASGIGRDFKIEFGRLDDKISHMPHDAAKDLKYWFLDVDDDFRHLGRSIDDELARIPGRVANAGSAIAAAAARVGSATRDGLASAGKRTIEGTKNVLASAAGVKRTPMKEWHAPSESESASSERES